MQAAKQFLLVQEAWETLRDAGLRREYDSRLDLQEAHVVVSDEVWIVKNTTYKHGACITELNCVCRTCVALVLHLLLLSGQCTDGVAHKRG